MKDSTPIFLAIIGGGLFLSTHILSSAIKKMQGEITTLQTEVYQLKSPKEHLLLLPDEMIEGPGRDN